MQLYIGNKNYSSWSLRAWLLMTQAGIEFSERRLRLDWNEGSAFQVDAARAGAERPGAPAHRRRRLRRLGFAGDRRDLAELFPAKRLWPGDRTPARPRAQPLRRDAFGVRGLARALSDEHRSLAARGGRLETQWPDVAADLRRIDSMWAGQLAEGAAAVSSAISASSTATSRPCACVKTYALPLGAAALGYVDRVHALPAMQARCAAARSEHDFITEDEPYRPSPDPLARPDR